MKASECRLRQNKDNIIKASLKLFRVNGIRKVSINDIAIQAAVSPGTIYNHFGNKEGLVRAVIKHFIDSIIEEYRKIIEADLTFMEKMERMIIYESELFAKDQGELLQTMASDDPEIHSIVESVYLNQNRQWLVDFFEEGKRQGHVNPGLSVDSILRYVGGIRLGQ